jgi:hypothetical protein
MLTRIASLLVLGCLATSTAQSQTCQCNGDLLDHYEGGDKNSLSWAFRSHSAKQSSGEAPSICYVKVVSNQSISAARQVTWEIAGFYRRYISPGVSSSSCPTIPGEMKPDPRSGLLVHGIADHYDTTVREPKEGWQQTTQAFYSPTPFSIFDPRFFTGTLGPVYASVQSSFIIEVSDATPNLPADIHVTSNAFNIPRYLTQLTYEFINTGKAPVRLLVNLPHDDLSSKDIPLLTTPVLLEPNSALKFSTSTEKTIGLQTATLVFYSPSGREIVAVESAGFHGLVEGRRELDTDAVWRSLRASP